MNKLSSVALSVTILLSACVPSNPSSTKSSAAFCVSEEFRVSDPFAKGAPVDDSFDTDDNPFDTRLLIPGDHVAEVVPGYHPRIKVRASDHWQSLYIIFDQIRDYKAVIGDTLTLEAVPEHENLVKAVSDDPYYWDMFERIKGQDMQFWGTCSDNYAGSFTCSRVIQRDGYQLTYELHQNNLVNYQGVDKLVLDSTSNCEP